MQSTPASTCAATSTPGSTRPSSPCCRIRRWKPPTPTRTRPYWCRDSWADPNEFAGLFDRWAALAKGEPRAADTVARLARTAPISWQATTGLAWLEAIIDGRHDEFANRAWFVTNWLGELHSAGAVTGAVVAPFHRIVDGLAAAGDSAAVSLQLLDEVLEISRMNRVLADRSY